MEGHDSWKDPHSNAIYRLVTDKIYIQSRVKPDWGVWVANPLEVKYHVIWGGGAQAVSTTSASMQASEGKKDAEYHLSWHA